VENNSTRGFEGMKNGLCNAPVYDYKNFELSSIITTDAYKMAVCDLPVTGLRWCRTTCSLK